MNRKNILGFVINMRENHEIDIHDDMVQMVLNHPPLRGSKSSNIPHPVLWFVYIERKLCLILEFISDNISLLNFQLMSRRKEVEFWVIGDNEDGGGGGKFEI